jgi:cell division septum initiation protein DivIVA
MQAEQEDLEDKNHQLQKAFKEKTKAHAQTQAHYQQLKSAIQHLRILALNLTHSHRTENTTLCI